MSSRERATGKPASRPIGQQSRDVGDWREETLARIRALILEADPELLEERKWRKASIAMTGVPVWSHNGIVRTGETYKKVVKLTFAREARIPDPSRLFNSSLEGNTRRAIDIHEGEKVDEGAFKALVKAAVAQNGPSTKKVKPGASEAKPVKPLSGRNPQRATASGEVELAVVRHRAPGLVPGNPHLHALRQGGLLPRHVAATGPSQRQQGRGYALHRHPRSRRARRGADGDLGEASRFACR